MNIKKIWRKVIDTAMVRNYFKKIEKSVKFRWFSSFILTIFYLNRVLKLQGFYVITYFFCIYQLQLVTQYFTFPEIQSMGKVQKKADDDLYLNFPINCKIEIQQNTTYQSTSFNNQNKQTELQQNTNQKSEFQTWQNNVLSICFAYFCTFIQFLDIPVYFQCLIYYFLGLIGITIILHLKKMKKYGYSIYGFRSN